MRRENLLARLLRALSGKSQEEISEEIGVYPSLIGQFERGQVLPSRQHLDRLARSAGLALRGAEEILNLYEVLRRNPRRQGRSAGHLFQGLAEEIRAHTEGVYRRILTLPLPDVLPSPEDRQRASELWERLKPLSPESRSGVVQVAEEFQSWSLCERVCEESVTDASRDLERAAGLARLAQEIAERVRGAQDWLNRLRGYALAHVANILRVQGELKAAGTAFEEAKRLWHAGSDPASVLDPGRMLDLEASLRRAQRRFGEALALLDEALVVGRSPGRVLINKGFTLEVMGEYERAIEALLQAQVIVERQGDRRLLSMVHSNLGFTYCHVRRFAEAAELARQAREVAIEMGDQLILLHMTCLEGRIAAGVGRLGEARSLLGQARREFAARGMSYDVALALLEESVLLLEEGSTAEVKQLAQELTGVFESKGVHREALAALRVFQDAAEREAATATLAHNILRFLFRARHDKGLRYES